MCYCWRTGLGRRGLAYGLFICIYIHIHKYFFETSERTFSGVHTVKDLLGRSRYKARGRGTGKGKGKGKAAKKGAEEVADTAVDEEEGSATEAAPDNVANSQAPRA